MSNTRSIQAQPSRALALPPAAKMAELDAIAVQYGNALANADTPFAATLTLAAGMGALRELLTPEIMAPIMALMNSPLGFLTDRTGKPKWDGDTKWKPCYTVEEVRDCVIEATLRGFRTVGNEFNIIAGRFYGAKEGFRRKVLGFPGLAKLDPGVGIPRLFQKDGKDTGAIVECVASWELHGKPDSITAAFAIKGDSFASSDSYQGKAERKILARIFARISGQLVPEGDMDEPPIKTADARDVTSRVDVSAPAKPVTKPAPSPARLDHETALRDACDAAGVTVADFIPVAVTQGIIERRATLADCTDAEVKALAEAAERLLKGGVV